MSARAGCVKTRVPNLNAYDLLQNVRRDSPVVHHITNWVTIYDCAQIVKTMGASPVMAHAGEEAADMCAIAAALVLNIGTLTLETVETMKRAAATAGAKGIPVVLDVCGAGATTLRNQKVAELLDAGFISIVKGNASEIASVAGAAVVTKGVDSTEVDADLAALAGNLATERRATVVVTGKVDIVTDGKTLFRVANGDPMMTHVVGTGCMATSVIGTFAAVEPDLVKAAACGLAIYEIAAELAARKARGPIAFKNALFDHLFALDGAAVAQRQKILQ
jgi:hydroxyethylthiazole kinase